MENKNILILFLYIFIVSVLVSAIMEFADSFVRHLGFLLIAFYFPLCLHILHLDNNHTRIWTDSNNKTKQNVRRRRRRGKKKGVSRLSEA